MTAQLRRPAISADGRFVAFRSDATNLVPGDTNGATDVFVRDRQTGTTRRVSVGPGGAQGNGGSFMPAISADGRFVAFESSATNLVPGDTNDMEDMFVHDRQTGTTRRVSVGPGGVQGNGVQLQPGDLGGRALRRLHRLPATWCRATPTERPTSSSATARRARPGG